MAPSRIGLTVLANVLHLDEVADLEDHAPDLGRVGVHDRVVQAPETERLHRRLLVLLPPAEAPDLPNPDLTRHERLPADPSGRRAECRATRRRRKDAADGAVPRPWLAPGCADCASPCTW